MSAAQQHKHEVDRATVAGAVAALFKWMRARTAEAPPNLLADERDDLLLLQLSLRRIPPSPTTKPRLLPLPHPVIVPVESASICVISDDRPKSRSPAASDLLDASRSQNLPVSEVIPLSALRTDYRPYESRRRLAASHDLFIADRAVLPLLPRVLGKAFYSTKKAPVAVDFARTGWLEQVRKVMSSTFLYLRTGTCSGIKVGRLDMKEEDIVENVMAAVEAAVEKVPKKWANVRSLHLKAVDSVALPIYQAVPELGMKIEVPVAQLEGEVGSGEVIDASEAGAAVKGVGKKKVKKTLKHVEEENAGEEAAQESGKRKRGKKQQAEDLMEQDIQDVSEKRKKVKEGTPAAETPKVSKKGKEKSKRALDKEGEDASVEEASNKKKKGKKEVVSDVGEKNSKVKKSNGGDKEKRRTRLRRFKCNAKKIYYDKKISKFDKPRLNFGLSNYIKVKFQTLTQILKAKFPTLKTSDSKFEELETAVPDGQLCKGSKGFIFGPGRVGTSWKANSASSNWPSLSGEPTNQSATRSHKQTLEAEIADAKRQQEEHVFGYIDWIPEHHGFQFSPCYKRSLPATERYIRGEAPLLSVSNSTEDQTPNGLSEAIVVRKGLSSICQRFPSFLHDFRLGQQLAFHLRELCGAVASEIHAKLARFLHRFWTTLQGSSKDIGWLKRTKTLPCSVDGLFSNHSPLYFVNTKRIFSKMGLTCHIARIHSEASVEKNARELKLYIEELYWGSGKQVLLLGHSKGGVDAAAALSLYWSELKGKVAGLALVQSPYGGTPIASDILRKGQIADKETRRIMELIICKLIKGDIRALEDLTYDKRRDFISKHKLPVDELPIISFHTEASTAPTMLVTLSRVAQAELLPWLPLPRFLSSSEYAESLLASLKLPVVVPASAAMAVSALHLRLRYGERSDGLVTRRDAEVPGSVVVRPERRLDHAWMVHSTLRKDHAEADATQMCEALMAMLVEIGRKKCC
uniref:Uncharacterized protein n=1 Tax=Oryza meridionalis TaxID=40149 RepID=A0A0E0DUP7_9ORYZ